MKRLHMVKCRLKRGLSQRNVSRHKFTLQTYFHQLTGYIALVVGTIDHQSIKLLARTKRSQLALLIYFGERNIALLSFQYLLSHVIKITVYLQ